jgi:hypothetical protein
MSQYHTTLGVSTEASQDHIKAVYRGLVKIYHPDVPVTGNAAKFREIDDAYKILTGQAQPPRTRSTPPVASTPDPKRLKGTYRIYVTLEDQKRGIIRTRVGLHCFNFRVSDAMALADGKIYSATNKNGVTADFIVEIEPPRPSVWKSFKETFMPTW